MVRTSPDRNAIFIKTCSQIFILGFFFSLYECCCFWGTSNGKFTVVCVV